MTARLAGSKLPRNDVQTAYRLPEALVERLDGLALEMERQSRMPCSRSDVVRMLLEEGLERRRKKR